MEHVNIHIIQYLAIGGSILLLAFILELVRRNKLREEYSLLWLFFGVFLLVFSIWRDGLDFLSKLVGIAYPPAAILLILIIAVYTILIHYSTVISKLTEKNKNLAQEMGLMQLRLKELEEKVNNK